MPAQEIEIKGRIVIWEDNESQLETNNHVLKRGEQVVILDPIRKKIGDGVSTYNQLKFDTNHNLISLTESATYVLHNVISQSTFFFKRVSSGITDVIFLLDSYKDTNRTFSQCDGRLHKIFIQNTLSSTFEVELALPTVEVNEGSSLVDIGTITIPGNGSALIEFCWFKNGNDNKVCFSRIQVSSNIVQDVSFLTSYSQLTSSTFNIYNSNRRQYNIIDINPSASTISVYISHQNDVGSIPTSKMAQYCLIKNTSAVTKTFAFMLFTSGHKLISEGLTAVAIEAGKSFEFSYIWLTRGSDNVCIVTKSNKFSEITQ